MNMIVKKWGTIIALDLEVERERRMKVKNDGRVKRI